MDVKTIYKQLTNVDIEQQKQIWDERGKGYYGEYLLFCKLYKSVNGNGKILMNLNVPTEFSKTTEIDLILIHETGLYVFEIKHYKGTIYGKDSDAIWTQYFRTVKNSTFKNPMEQNRYHIEALKKMFPDMPIFSCIVFTNDECDIRVTNSNEGIDICTLNNVGIILERRFAKNNSKFSMQDIDNIFEKLSVFSQMKEFVTIDGEEANFFSWVEPAVSELKSNRSELEKEKERLKLEIEKTKKAKVKGIVFNIIVAILTVILVGIFSFGAIKKNNIELAEFKQKFLHIDEINNEYIDELNSYVDVSKVSLVPLTDDAVSFKARVSMKNDTYGIVLTEGSKYIVSTVSGKVYEYNVFGENLFYSRFSNMIGTGIRSYGDLAEIQFYGISEIDDISYIKITGVELFKLDLDRTVIKNNLEIELYSK